VVNSTDFAPKKLNFANIEERKTAAPNFVCGPQKNIYESWAGRGHMT